MSSVSAPHIIHCKYSAGCQSGGARLPLSEEACLPSFEGQRLWVCGLPVDSTAVYACPDTSVSMGLSPRDLLDLAADRTPKGINWPWWEQASSRLLEVTRCSENSLASLRLFNSGTIHGCPRPQACSESSMGGAVFLFCLLWSRACEESVACKNFPGPAAQCAWPPEM